MLSVSGARGIVGRSMTPPLAAEFAAAFGSHLRARTGIAAPAVCIGRDGRMSGQMLSAAAAAGLTATGCRVIDLGVVATPTVGVMIGRCRAAGGIVITASHNPVEWNGLKCLIGHGEEGGFAPPRREADAVIVRFHERAIDYADVPSLVPMERHHAGDSEHVRRVLDIVDVEAIRRAGIKIVLDSINGGGGSSGRMLLEELGCELVHLNSEPTGRFTHAPEPVRENLADLAERTSRERAVCGFAQDPDADRLAIIDESGRYIGEEYTLALAALRALEREGSGTLAANLSTSRMIDDIAARFPGSDVVRTAVGEANVVEAMQGHGAIIGGEGNGGVIWPRVCWIRDSLAAMALVLELLASRSAPLSSVVDELPRYAMVKTKFDLTDIGGLDAVGEMLQRVRKEYASQRVSDADGVRVDFDDGWVHLRASNTEPILRLIAEADSEDRARALIDHVARAAGVIVT